MTLHELLWKKAGQLLVSDDEADEEKSNMKPTAIQRKIKATLTLAIIMIYP